jgi:hypothetical protein
MPKNTAVVAPARSRQKRKRLPHGGMVRRVAVPNVARRRMTFELEDFHRNISDEELIADLVRVSQDLNKKQITLRL